MLDAIGVVFILTGTSTYLVTKHVTNNWTKSSFNRTIEVATSGQLPMSDASALHPLDNTYAVQVSEEDTDLPKQLLHITALTVDRKSSENRKPSEGIMYLLSGDGVDDERPEESKFAINAFTGQLFLVAPLDSDPPSGRPLWTLNISAENDAGDRMQGWAIVLVRVNDINDNRPEWTPDVYSVRIAENNGFGQEVARLSDRCADRDPNDVIRYSIDMNRVDGTGSLIFAVNELTGSLSAAVCCLDREQIDHYVLKVCASDGRHKTCARVTVVVSDLNDELPKFTVRSVAVDLWDRELKAGKVVTELVVVDRDLPETNRLSFRVVDTTSVDKHFAIRTGSDAKSALLVISRDIDLETELLANSDVTDIAVTVVVSDSADLSDTSRLDYCSVKVRIKRSVAPTVTTEVGAEADNSTGTVNVSRRAVSNGDQLFVWNHVIVIAVSLSAVFALSVAVGAALVYRKRMSGDRRSCGSDSPDRDQVRHYAEEGGECDHWMYDLTPLQMALQKPLLPDVCTKEQTMESHVIWEAID